MDCSPKCPRTLDERAPFTSDSNVSSKCCIASFLGAAAAEALTTDQKLALLDMHKVWTPGIPTNPEDPFSTENLKHLLWDYPLHDEITPDTVPPHVTLLRRGDRDATQLRRGEQEADRLRRGDKSSTRLRRAPEAPEFA